MGDREEFKMKSLKQKILLGALIAGVGFFGFSPAKSINNATLEQKVSSEIATSAIIEENASTAEWNDTFPRNYSDYAEKNADLKIITGYIKSIDEDSLPIIFSECAKALIPGTNDYEDISMVARGDFQFENMRIYSEADKKVYKLIFPGPSNYQVGDHVKFKYTPMTTISFEQLVKEYSNVPANSNTFVRSILPPTTPQRGYFNIEGLIKRQDEGW